MIERRPFGGLGGANHGWLDAKHHFSFASYHDPNKMGWGPIRVWNDDTIAPKSANSAADFAVRISTPGSAAAKPSVAL